MIKTSILEHIETINLLNQFAPKIEIFAQKLITLFGKDKKLIICGNGGSAITASHYINDWVKSVNFYSQEKDNYNYFFLEETIIKLIEGKL